MTTASASSRWLELAVTSPLESVEIVAALLADYGLDEGVIIEAPFTQDADSDEAQIDPTRPVIVRTFLDDADVAEAAIDDIRQVLPDLRQEHGISNLVVRTLTVPKREDEDWDSAWLTYASMLRVGSRVVLKAWWHDYEPAPGEIVLELEAGLAFGSGGHATTRLCVLALEEAVRPGARVLDVGTGSGILALTAARLGASAVDAVDIDPVAIGVARSNAARNEVADVVRVEHGSVGPGEPFQGEYDLVVANILARVLTERATSLTEAVRAGGTLILSGIADFREGQVREAFETLGWRVVRRDELEGWVMVVLRRSE